MVKKTAFLMDSSMALKRAQKMDLQKVMVGN